MVDPNNVLSMPTKFHEKIPCLRPSAGLMSARKKGLSFYKRGKGISDIYRGRVLGVMDGCGLGAAR